MGRQVNSHHKTLSRAVQNERSQVSIIRAKINYPSDKKKKKNQGNNHGRL